VTVSKKNVSQRGLGSHRPHGTTAGLRICRKNYVFKCYAAVWQHVWNWVIRLHHFLSSVPTAIAVHLQEDGCINRYLYIQVLVYTDACIYRYLYIQVLVYTGTCIYNETCKRHQKLKIQILIKKRCILLVYIV